MTRIGFVLGLTAGVVGGSAGAATDAPPWGWALEGNPITATQLREVRQATGLTPRLVVFFQQWPEDLAARDFPSASLDAIEAAGATPVVTWEPMYYRRADGAETMIAASRIAAGEYDAYLKAYARAAAAWGRPLIIRFAHEMNLSRYHWGGTTAEYGPASPERFRSMWRHVVGIFRAAGAANVRWAFCPNCESVPGAGNPAAAPWNRARAYYPGDDVVDLLGMDGYNWGDTQTPAKNGWRSSWRSFASTFGGLRAELQAIAPGKPLYVFETATAPTGGDKGAWVLELIATTRAWQLAGVVWFEANKEVDWRLAPGLSAAAREALVGK
jgi:mannan endo-1,4-beta-mannosidase